MEVKTDKPTKKEISKRKACARATRKEKADERKANKAEEERKNPITVKRGPNGEWIFKGRSLSITSDKNEALKPFGKQLLLYGVQFQLDPDDKQAGMFRKTFGCVRVVRNDYLQMRNDQYQKDKSTLTVQVYKSTRLHDLKNEKPWLREVDKFALEAGIEHVEEAFGNFFDGRADFPKFVSKYKPNGNKYTTKFTNGNIRFEALENVGYFIKLPKVGIVRLVMPKRKNFESIVLPGSRITKATVSLDNGKFFVSVAMELVVDLVKSITEFRTDRSIAMDMGLRKFCDYGTGNGDYNVVENPRWIRKHAKRLRRLQKSMSRKKYDKDTHKGSKNWEKAKAKVAKEQRKIRNQRKDFHHKLSREIVNKCDVFICEDLNIKGMVRNHHLAKEISSAGWGQFLTFVKYKLERKGGIFLKVDRFFPSSKLCQCGHKNTDLKAQLMWRCPACGRQNERDHNAVENLHAEGVRILEERGIRCIPAAA